VLTPSLLGRIDNDVRLSLIAAAVLAASLQLVPSVATVNEKAAVDAMEALDFVGYGRATIFPEQIPKDDGKKFFVMSVRVLPGRYAEWRAKGGVDALAKASGAPKR
jgi:hypothetical protein